MHALKYSPEPEADHPAPELAPQPMHTIRHSPQPRLVHDAATAVNRGARDDNRLMGQIVGGVLAVLMVLLSAVLLNAGLNVTVVP